MDGVLWGKLLLNLNNALNALCGLPLRDQLLDRPLRRVLAAAQAEALDVLAAAGVHPRLHLPVPAWGLPPLLRLPTWLFERVAQRMLAVGPQARSSMWEDLQRGRKTEVDALNGAVVALGVAQAVPTPVNAALVEAVHAAEAGADPAAFVEALVLRCR
jgi:2-dehydropantoate 2-reductase